MEATIAHIALVEPYFTGSHRQWLEGFERHLPFKTSLVTLPGRYWKWRMHGGAISLSEQLLKLEDTPDLVLASDMTDLSILRSLTREKLSDIPFALYFHENQITYPWSPTDRDISNKRDHHYGFINFASALTADHCFFNSAFHKDSFLEALPGFLKQFPDCQPLSAVEEIANKSSVLPIAVDLKRYDKYQEAGKRLKERHSPDTPIILWNHRWEYDKGADEFLATLRGLQERSFEFKLVMLGESFQLTPETFSQIRELFDDRVLQFGYVESFEEYASWLWASDLAPVTSHQDFFGVSAVEAAYCGCLPLLPRRLSFPEVFVEKELHELFYSKTEELVDKLISLVSASHELRSSVATHVARYDWTNSLPQYTEATKSLLQ